MRLALGTAQFGLPYGIANRGGQIARTDARAMLQLAAASGIDMLDTAIAYGESETRLGEIGTEGFRLVTKLPEVPEGCTAIGAWVEGQMEASLARLGASSVYGVLLHRPAQLLESGGETLYRALQDLKNSGHARKVGISIYSPNELDALIPRHRFDLVQAPFNLVDRRLAATGWLQRLKREGVEVHTRSAFLQGLLLMEQGAMPARFSEWSDLWHVWHRWLERHGVQPVQACLGFPLSFPEIDRIVVGADSPSQLNQLVGAAAGDVIVDFPDLQCEAEGLIDPSRWRRP